MDMDKFGLLSGLINEHLIRSKNINGIEGISTVPYQNVKSTSFGHNSNVTNDKLLQVPRINSETLNDILLDIKGVITLNRQYIQSELLAGNEQCISNFNSLFSSIFLPPGIMSESSEGLSTGTETRHVKKEIKNNVASCSVDVSFNSDQQHNHTKGEHSCSSGMVLCDTSHHSQLSYTKGTSSNTEMQGPLSGMPDGVVVNDSEVVKMNLGCLNNSKPFSFICCEKTSLNDLTPDLLRRLGNLPVVGFMVVDLDGTQGLVAGLPLTTFLDVTTGAMLHNGEVEKHNATITCNASVNPAHCDTSSNLSLNGTQKSDNNLEKEVFEEANRDGSGNEKQGEHFILDDGDQMSSAEQQTDGNQRIKNFKCEMCDRAYYTLSHLKGHIRAQHTHEKPYACDICGKCYARSDSLSAHRRLHFGIKRYKCEFCGKGFGYHSHWKIHVKSHSKRQHWECKQCCLSFRTKQEHKNHMKTHRGLLIVSSHEKSIDQEEERLLRCESCDKAFGSSEDYNAHLRYHSEKSGIKYHRSPRVSVNDIFLCKHCKTVVCGRKNFLRHKRMYRLHKYQRITCCQCGKKFCNDAYLTRHELAVHKAQENMIFSCEKCPHVFGSRKLLAGHWRNNHSKGITTDTLAQEKTYHCDYCNFQCLNEVALLDHFSGHHPEEPPFKCSFCSSRFWKQIEMNNHELVHTKTSLQDTVACNHCYEVFFDTDSLARHMSEVEVDSQHAPLEQKNEKLHDVEFEQMSIDSDPAAQRDKFLLFDTPSMATVKCDICNKELASAFDVKEHFQVTHGGIAPYNCSKCTKRFVAPLLRRIHSAEEHPDEDEEFAVGDHLIKQEGEEPFEDSNNAPSFCPVDDEDTTVSGGSKSERRIPRRRVARERSFGLYSFASSDIDFDPEAPHDSADALDEKRKRPGVKPRTYTVVHCDLCNEVLVTAMKAKEHFIKFHSGIGPYKCDVCEQRFQSLYIRKNHMLKHQDDGIEVRKRFPCTKCGKTFMKSYSLKEHLLRHNQSEECYGEGSAKRLAFSPKRQELICDLCGEMLVTALKAKEHFIEHHEGLPPYKCFVCEKRLWSVHTRKEHMALHEDFSMLRNTYTCEKCNKTFAKKASLQEHLLRHTKAENAEFVKNELGQYPCKVCTEVFSSQSEVMAHFQTYHEMGCQEDRTFRKLQVMMCDLCGEKLVTGLKAKAHFVEKHNALPPYCCTKCDKRFHSAYAKNRHLLSHEENFHELRPKFPCNQCDKVFFSKFTLKKHSAVHVKRTETAHLAPDEERPYIFEVHMEEQDPIEIVEPSESDLEPKPKNRRKGIYSSQQGDLDFSCMYCGSSFRYQHHLITHVSKQHSEKEGSYVKGNRKYQCELCGMWLASEVKIADHFLVEHGGIGAKMCYICDKRFDVPNDRMHHLALHQLNEDDDVDIVKFVGSHDRLGADGDIENEEMILTADFLLKNKD